MLKFYLFYANKIIKSLDKIKRNSPIINLNDYFLSFDLSSCGSIKLE